MEKLDIGAVFNAAEIFEATGLRLEGYRHKLDNFGIRHGFKNHGDEKLELKRKQWAVTVSDVLHIPSAAHFPDRIRHGGKTALGLDVIQLDKQLIGKVLHYRAEVRRGRRELATVTFFISNKKIR